MLRYLFKAEFTDGTSIMQTQEDVSLLVKGKNCWHDVLNSGKEVSKVTYLEQKLWNPTVISVDLKTGNFELNGKQVYIEPVVDKKTGKEIRLKRKPVRYMGVKKHFNATFNVKNKNLAKMEVIGEERIFFIGWESGKYKQVIGVK